MTTTRRRSPQNFHSFLFVQRFVSRHRTASIVLARTTAGVVLMAGIALVSRIMYVLSWRTDGLIAALVAAGWMVYVELGRGGL